MSFKKIRFVTKAACDAFTKDLTAGEFKPLSDKEIEVSFADMDGDEKMRSMYQSMSRLFDYAMNRVYQVESMLYDHAYGPTHLPDCPSTEHMAKAVKALGWAENYEVKKREIYASLVTRDVNGNLLVEMNHKG